MADLLIKELKCKLSSKGIFDDSTLITSNIENVLMEVSVILNELYLSGSAESLLLWRELSSIMLLYLKSMHDHSEKVYRSFARPGSSFLHAIESENWKEKSIAFQCLHHLLFANSETVAIHRQLSKDVFPCDVVSAVQKSVVNFLQKQYSLTSDLIYKLYLQLTIYALGILHNLIVCAPNQTLLSVILSACLPFAFLGLADIDCKSFSNLKDIAAVDSSKEISETSEVPSKNCVNKNRKKRLRRKKAQFACIDSEKKVGICSSRMPLLSKSYHLPSSNEIVLRPSWISKTTKEDSSFGSNAQLTRSDDDSNVSTSSELDVSDLDMSHSKNKGVLLCKVRQQSLITINAIIDKAGRQHKFSFWPPLMCQTPSVICCILRDKSSSVRTAALQVVSTFLIDSSSILSQAVSMGGSGPYTTFSLQLGKSLEELHRCLILALLSEHFSVVLVRILKTIELLVENVNYARLKYGLLSKTVTHIKSFMEHKDFVIRASAYSVIVSVLMIKPQVPELKELLLKYNSLAPSSWILSPNIDIPLSVDEALSDDEDCCKIEQYDVEKKADATSEPSMVSWIMRRCIESLKPNKALLIHGMYIQVQLQALKVVRALVKEHLSLMVPSIPMIQHIIIDTCNIMSYVDANSEELKLNHLEGNFFDFGTIMEHSYFVLAALLNSIKEVVEGKEVLDILPATVLQLWLWTLQEPLSILIKASCNAAQSSNDKKDDCISELPMALKQISVASNVFLSLYEEVLENLGEEWVTKILIAIYWLLNHSELELRLSGLKVMAIIVNFPSIQMHSHGRKVVASSVETAVKILSKKGENVNRDRLLATWSLANVSYTFDVFRSGGGYIEEPPVFSLHCLMAVLSVSIQTCHDKDKIKYHGVRCIGNIIKFLFSSFPESNFDQGALNLIEEAVNALTTCANPDSTMKTKWNACHALGNVLSTQKAFLLNVPWRGKVIKVLANLVENYKNYKVKIQSCNALCSIHSREFYDIEYYNVWKSFFLAMESVSVIVDFHEIQHRDDFLEQLVQGICHLISLLKLEDCEALSELLQLHQESVESNVKKALKDLAPEKASITLTASDHLLDLLSSDVLSDSQENVLNSLFGIIKLED